MYTIYNVYNIYYIYYMYSMYIYYVQYVYTVYALYINIYLTAEGHAYTTSRYRNVLIMVWKDFIIGLHFLNEGRGERVLLLTFSVKEKARGFC